jgi:glycosyltransferase involved in cell wall biosynthesis
MDTAARWVINEVLPIVKKAIPEVHFYIIGREAEISLSYVKDLSVTVIGKVPSVLPYLCNADVSIVPLKFESGTRFKILEAGSCGTPVVSTTLGAEGILVQQKENILIADTPEDFAAAIVLLINNRELAKSIATNCYEMVKYNYSLLRAENEATQIVDYLKGQFL